MEMNTPELSNVAKVLISRMETHPEDFDYNGRFSGLTGGLDALSGAQALNLGGDFTRSFWTLSETDKEALKEAWRKLNYHCLEKRVMDIIFAEEDTKPKYTVSAGGGLGKVTSAQLQQWTDPRLIQAAQNSILTTANSAQNAYPQGAQNSTGLSSTGGFFQSIFGGLK
jgi:hypothetical protein